MNLSLRDIVKTNGVVKHPTVDSKGYSIDLYSPGTFRMEGTATANIPSGVHLTVPEGYVASIHPIAKLAFDSGFSCPAQIIPPNFKEQLTINLVHNRKDTFIVIEKDEKIAQIVITPAVRFHV